jgi:hypothetical protein
MCSRPPSAVRRRHGRGLEALVPALVGPQVVPVDRRDGGRGPVSPSRTRHGSRARDVERDATRGSTDHGRTDGGGGDARARQLTPFWLSARLRVGFISYPRGAGGAQWCRLPNRPCAAAGWPRLYLQYLRRGGPGGLVRALFTVSWQFGGALSFALHLYRRRS